LLDLIYAGGFTVGGAGDVQDCNPGCTSWFFFVGPPEVRAKIPLADSRREKGKGPLQAPGIYPVPGRMQPR
jgi:hypothetical protein